MTEPLTFSADFTDVTLVTKDTFRSGDKDVRKLKLEMKSFQMIKRKKISRSAISYPNS